MKHILIFLAISYLFLHAPLSINAQTEKGKILLGGNYSLDFSSVTSTFKSANNSVKNNITRSLEIIPQAGYFIFNNFAAGLEIQYNHNYDEYINGSTYYSTSFAGVPFLRYYIGGAKIKPYLHGGIGPGWQQDKTANNSTVSFKTNYRLLVYKLNAGFGIFLNEHISLDLGFGFHSTTELHKEPMESGIYDEWRVINNGTGATIGFMIFL